MPKTISTLMCYERVMVILVFITIIDPSQRKKRFCSKSCQIFWQINGFLHDRQLISIFVGSGILFFAIFAIDLNICNFGCQENLLQCFLTPKQFVKLFALPHLCTKVYLCFALMINYHRYCSESSESFALVSIV